MDQVAYHIGNVPSFKLACHSDAQYYHIMFNKISLITIWTDHVYLTNVLPECNKCNDHSAIYI